MKKVGLSTFLAFYSISVFCASTNILSVEEETLTRGGCSGPAASFPCGLTTPCFTVGTITATGDATFSAPVFISDTTPTTSCFDGALVVAGGEAIGGDLNVCGTITAGGFRKNGVLANELRSVPGCSGGISGCTGPNLTLEVLGGAGILDDLTVCGTIFGNNLNVCNNATVQNLNVLGTGTINNIVITGTGTISYDNLTVTGTLTANNLNVGGTSNFSGPVSVNNITINGTGTANNFVINNNLTVGGTAIINNEMVNYITGNTGVFNSLITNNFTTNNFSTTNLTVTGTATINNETVNTITGSTGSFKTLNVNNLNVTGPVSFSNSTNSTGCNNGAVTVSGGVGVGGNINVCGTGGFNNLTVTGNSTLNNATVNNLTVTGSSSLNTETVNVLTGGTGTFNNLTANTLTVTGNSTLNTETVNVITGGTGAFNTLKVNNLNVTGPASFSGPVSISNTTQSTGCTNGALTVSGGVGIGGNLNVCGSVSGPISYKFSSTCTGVTGRTVQSKLDDYWINIKDFGAVGNGTADDTAAIQAAINCAVANGGGTVFFPCGTFQITSALNCTIIDQNTPVRFLGSNAGIAQGTTTCEILGNTPNMMFDCTEGGSILFENLNLRGGTSTIGIVMQEGTLDSSDENRMVYVSILMPSNPTANGGQGTVAFYNNGAELFTADSCTFKADTPLIVTNQSVNASFNSIYATASAGPNSCSMIEFESCLFLALSYNAILLYGPSQYAMDQINFKQFYCLNEGTAYNPGTFCITANASLIDSSFYGHAEEFLQYINFQQVVTHADLFFDGGSTAGAGVPLIALTDVASNYAAPSVQGSTINFSAANVPLLMQITTNSNVRQATVFDNIIYLYGSQGLDFSNGISGGNMIFAYQTSSVPSILQGTGTHGYLLFNQSSTMNFDGNLNLYGTGAYQQGGQFLVGQDITGNNVAVGLNSFGSPALPSATVTGIDNTAVGAGALGALTSGNQNCAFGFQALNANNVGSSNVAMGYDAMQSVTGGANNVAIGFVALQNGKNANTNVAIGSYAMNAAHGSNNVALGNDAMISASGSGNVAIGVATLASNVSSSQNIAIGSDAMASITSGSSNIAVGQNALNTANAASLNVAIGSSAQSSAVNASSNVAIGVNAMSNASGTSSNIALGQNAMQNAPSATLNVAIGAGAMGSAIAANTNVAIGEYAMANASGSTQNVALGMNAMVFATGTNLTGSNNVAIGTAAMANAMGSNSNVAIGAGTLYSNTGSNNVAIGTNALDNSLTGAKNIAIGNNAGSALVAGESNNIDIANNGVAGDQGVIRLGTQSTQTSCYVAGVFGVTGATGSAIPVYISSNGQLGTVASSRRYKTDICDISGQQEKMLKLRPVTFAYKHDTSNNKQYGLIAEEVAELYPEMIVRDGAGEIYTINYLALIPLLLNQIQEMENEMRVRDMQYNAQISELRTMVNKLMVLLPA